MASKIIPHSFLLILLVNFFILSSYSLDILPVVDRELSQKSVIHLHQCLPSTACLCVQKSLNLLHLRTCFVRQTNKLSPLINRTRLQFHQTILHYTLNQITSNRLGNIEFLLDIFNQDQVLVFLAIIQKTHNLTLQYTINSMPQRLASFCTIR